MKEQTTIRNCNTLSFRFVCPRQWKQLAATDDAGQRFCDQCQQIVYLCLTDEETLSHARAGHCVARARPAVSELPPDDQRMLRGLITMPTFECSDSQKLAREWDSREAAISSAIENIDGEWVCKECGYPAAVSQPTTSCDVCGHEMGQHPDPEKRLLLYQQRAKECGYNSTYRLGKAGSIVEKSKKNKPVKSQTCPHCNKPLRTAKARQCFECGADWH